MRMHFISGLPRSGSSLLASILLQNPRFHASIMSPVGQIVTDMLVSTGEKNEAASYISNAQRHDMLRGVFTSYYAETDKPVVFDNNRRWSSNISLCARLFPDSFVLACVRDPREIVDSFERLFQRHPAYLSAVYGRIANTTVYERVNEMIKPTGVVGYSLNALRSAFYGPQKTRMLIIRYDQLARFPDQVMTDLHNVLGEDPFTYDFQNIQPIPGTDEFDMGVGTPELHDLRPQVTYEPRPTVLPPDILAHLPGPFWINDLVTSSG